jgi:thiol-disulfide isomerase/thioredoxin
MFGYIMKKLINFLYVLGFILILLLPSHQARVLAQDNPTPQEDKIIVHFFWGKGCPHCDKQKIFLDNLEKKYDDILVIDYEVWSSQENLNLLKQVGTKLEANISGIPFTVIGENYLSGWLDEKTSGAKLEEYLSCARENKCPDIVSQVGGTDPSKETLQEKSSIPEEITLPFIGTINVRNFSLPALSVVIGIIDGFNPCAMWVLIFLISFLVGMKDKKRMWIFGITFIAASAFVYFLFMTAWLNLILFLGFISWIRVIIALIAIGGGIYNLREFLSTKHATCHVTNSGQKEKIIDKLKQYTHEKSFWMAIGGLVILAFSVNLIEAVCSAGLPVIFTQILTLSDLPTWKYYMYILIYVFFFMLDDLIVFFLAMFTLKITGLTTKYTRYSHLIGGVLMILIGITLIFKPEWLMFG